MLNSLARAGGGFTDVDHLSLFTCVDFCRLDMRLVTEVANNRLYSQWTRQDWDVNIHAYFTFQ